MYVSSSLWYFGLRRAMLCKYNRRTMLKPYTRDRLPVSRLRIQDRFMYGTEYPNMIILTGKITEGDRRCTNTSRPPCKAHSHRPEKPHNYSLCSNLPLPLPFLLLLQLYRPNVGCDDDSRVFCSCITSLLEYLSVVYHGLVVGIWLSKIILCKLELVWILLEENSDNL
ncbi:hypothetical protein BDP27DRAFT_555882 [Rhodocollybia butyracea]|uniref:Uncharacterized protein n=1 Tax=Rhodocollybia butyracea TaxID=206335 RepID=A0A9P5TWV4_9AGAR|nr:hypothetical protein BDP27DRAFT_555882 [Rhodocollybia butyracea]